VVPVGESVAIVLAIACSASFGVGGVLLGLYFGVRSVTRDEGRYAEVAAAYDSVAKVVASLRAEWVTAQENLEQLVEAVETRRRRIAASRSAEDRKARGPNGELEAPRLTPQQERDALRQTL